VRHLCNFLNFPEKLANALATRKCLRHLFSRFVEPPGRDDSPESRNPSRPSGVETLAITFAIERSPTAAALPPLRADIGDSRGLNPKSPVCVSPQAGDLDTSHRPITRLGTHEMTKRHPEKCPRFASRARCNPRLLHPRDSTERGRRYFNSTFAPAFSK